MPLDIFGALAGIGSYAGNMVSSAISSSRQWKYQQRAMDYQDYLNRQFTKWNLQNSPTYSRMGYTKAGYNPLLALGSSMSGNGAIYSGSAGISDSDQGSEAISSAIDSLRLRNENKLNKSQINLNKSQEDLNTQATYKTFADELKSRAEANVASAQEAKIYNDIDWDNLINDARLKEIIANTKFQNERARGHSASTSKSYGGSISPDFSIDKKKGKVGFGISGSGNYSQSESKTW